MALLALLAVAGQSRAACELTASRARDRLSRELCQETALLCQQHETLLSSLLPRRPSLDRLRMVQYLTAFLYDSCGLDETLPGPVRSLALGEERFALIRLQRTAELPGGADRGLRELPPFPPPLLLRPCQGCVREALRNAGQTMRNGRISPLDGAGQAALRNGGDIRSPDGTRMPSDRVIRKMIAETGSDYRDEAAPPSIGTVQERPRDRAVFVFR